MLKIQGLKKSHSKRVILDSIDLELFEGEIGVILGESGSGKTTLLRCLSGLERNYTGHIWIQNSAIFQNTRPSERGLGFLFQDLALFPHLTVQQNIEVSLHDLDSRFVAERTIEVMELCQIRSHAKKYPQQLSGGEQQRVALARSIAPRPKLLLLDEPFSSLDPSLRSKVREEVKNLLKSLNMTCLMVTHDINEAYFMADKMGILKNGKMRQWSTSYEIYHHPKDPYTASYLDWVSFADIVVKEEGDLELEGQIIGTLSSSEAGKKITVMIRPENVHLSPDGPVHATLVKKIFQGANSLYELEGPLGNRFYCFSDSRHPHLTGDQIAFHFKFSPLIHFPEDE